MSVASDNSNRNNVTANSLFLWLFNLSILSFTMTSESLMQELYCRFINWVRASQLCILISCGYLCWSLNVVKVSFLDDGRGLHLPVCTRVNICSVVRVYSSLGKWYSSKIYTFNTSGKLAMFPVPSMASLLLIIS